MIVLLNRDSPRALASITLLVIFALLTQVTRAQSDDPVSVKTSMTALERQPDTYVVSVELSIKRGWYIYASSPGDSNLLVTEVELELPDGVQALAEWQLPTSSPHAQTKGASVYRGKNTFRQTIRVEPGRTINDIGVRISYQSCDKSICLRPKTTTVKIALPSASNAGLSIAKLRAEGAFGFPQDKSEVICDREDLRVSAWSNRDFFIVQAIVWHDTSAEIGETGDGRAIGDHSKLHLDVNGEGILTSRLDRQYYLNPWPSRPGLRYQIQYDRGSSKISGDSTGRGAIRYLPVENDRKIRIDTYAIPLSEIGRTAGDSIRFDSP